MFWMISFESRGDDFLLQFQNHPHHGDHTYGIVRIQWRMEKSKRGSLLSFSSAKRYLRKEDSFSGFFHFSWSTFLILSLSSDYSLDSRMLQYLTLSLWSSSSISWIIVIIQKNTNDDYDVQWRKKRMKKKREYSMLGTDDQMILSGSVKVIQLYGSLRAFSDYPTLSLSLSPSDSFSRSVDRIRFLGKKGERRVENEVLLLSDSLR